MSRFAQTYEDPSYEYLGESDEGDWQDIKVKPFGEWSESAQDRLLKDVVNGWVRLTVAEKQQETYSPFGTSNS